MDLEHSKTEMGEKTNLRILEWIYGLIVGEQEGQSKQRVTYLQVNTLRKETPLLGRKPLLYKNCRPNLK